MEPPPAAPSRPPMIRLAVTFYAVMTVSAFVWAGIAGRLPFWVGDPPPLESVARWGVVGLLFGLCVVVVSILIKDLPFVREVGRTLQELLGPISWGQAFILAVLSGIGEELLFRGAMQPTLGLEITSVLFALVHWPMTPRLIPWTISAGLMGLAFGYGFEASGHVAGPVVAHFIINFLNLRALGSESPADEEPSDPDQG